MLELIAAKANIFFLYPNISCMCVCVLQAVVTSSYFSKSFVKLTEWICNGICSLTLFVPLIWRRKEPLSTDTSRLLQLLGVKKNVNEKQTGITSKETVQNANELRGREVVFLFALVIMYYVVVCLCVTNETMFRLSLCPLTRIDPSCCCHFYDVSTTSILPALRVIFTTGEETVHSVHRNDTVTSSRPKLACILHKGQIGRDIKESREKRREKRERERERWSQCPSNWT